MPKKNKKSRNSKNKGGPRGPRITPTPDPTANLFLAQVISSLGHEKASFVVKTAEGQYHASLRTKKFPWIRKNDYLLIETSPDPTLKMETRGGRGKNKVPMQKANILHLYRENEYRLIKPHINALDPRRNEYFNQEEDDQETTELARAKALEAEAWDEEDEHQTEIPSQISEEESEEESDEDPEEAELEEKRRIQAEIDAKMKAFDEMVKKDMERLAAKKKAQASHSEEEEMGGLSFGGMGNDLEGIEEDFM